MLLEWWGKVTHNKNKTTINDYKEKNIDKFTSIK